MADPLVIYVDVDDTLVRSVGSKRIPMPGVVKHVRSLAQNGVELYCWSTGGAAYAEQAASELGIAALFTAFLPKPNILIDDLDVAEWRQFVQIHPQTAATQELQDYIRRLAERG